MSCKMPHVYCNLFDDKEWQRDLIKKTPFCQAANANNQRDWIG